MKLPASILLALLLTNLPARSQSVAMVKFDQLKQMVDRSNDTLYVVNFWATWCAPCVKELPLFESVRRQYATQKVAVLLVSMDNKKTLSTKVVPFVRNRKIQSKVVLLDEPDLNTWVDKLTPEWSGALPMTLILNKQRNIRKFIGQPVEKGELESIINQSKR
ncbi:TlpA disulfide reductase family protein [Spirosoma validum]|uniref:TlpA family protein disulfide reductase n=1 Tax=Spirosoma validum TaxID=2771355 RepID=A0A927B5L5_9BACT|nr:TlpA disulfide reductase family protein [Spirosoma validum]MBD2756095.1 TlpA family protein disulfide reductase [Spirosoma validum]